MSCDTEKEVLFINTIVLYFSKSAELANIVFKAYKHKQQFSGKQVQVLEYECSLNKVPVRKSQVQILKSEYNNCITVLQ